jgi:tRNA-(ms[2]io[6]A)-hydroxylase
LEPSPYAAQLLKICRTPRIERLVDTLICCAFIEARSCERMKLLAENLEDPTLARLYRSLLASEARHHQCYLDLAAPYADRDALGERIEVLSAHEASVIAAAPPMVRLHT